MSEGERLRGVVVDDDEDHASMLEAVPETIGYDATVTHSCAADDLATARFHDYLVKPTTLERLTFALARGLNERGPA